MWLLTFCQPPSLASTGEGGRAQQCRDVTELGGNMAQISSLSLGEERAAVWQQGQTNYSSSNLVIGCPTPPLSLTRESFKLESTQSNKYNLRWARPGRSQQCYCYCSGEERGRNNNYEWSWWTTTPYSAQLILLRYFLLTRLIISTQWGRKLSFNPRIIDREDKVWSDSSFSWSEVNYQKPASFEISSNLGRKMWCLWCWHSVRGGLYAEVSSKQWSNTWILSTNDTLG